MNQFLLRHHLVLLVLGFIGCGNESQNRERFLLRIIEDGTSLKKNAIEGSNGVVEDVTVSRDGDQDGVVFECTYAKGYKVDKSQMTDENLRSLAKAKFKSSTQTLKALKMGIYYKMIYKSHAGKILGEIKISDEDFE